MNTLTLVKEKAAELAAEKKDERTFEKQEKLKKLGFFKHPEVQEMQVVAEKNVEKDRIQKYAKSYPDFYYVSEEVLEKVCKQHKLVMGDFSDFIGDIPDGQIDMIERGRLEIHDADKKRATSRSSYRRTERMKICAPQKLFHESGPMISINGWKRIKDLDPIVVQEMYHGGYLVIAAWGGEAETLAEESVS